MQNECMSKRFGEDVNIFGIIDEGVHEYHMVL